MEVEKDINLKVSMKEAGIIFKALGALPFHEVYELFGKMNNQINQQAGKSENPLDGTNF